MLKATGLFILVIISLQGCASSTVNKEGPADVTSSPSAATVYANGEKIGVTPLHYNLYKAFPAGWKNMMFQAQGVLMLKKEGCEDYVLNVNDYILSQPVHAELKCDESSRPVAPDPAASDINEASQAPVVLPPTDTEKRLKELESLYEKGIITKDEYTGTRAKILNEL